MSISKNSDEPLRLGYLWHERLPSEMMQHFVNVQISGILASKDALDETPLVVYVPSRIEIKRYMLQMQEALSELKKQQQNNRLGSFCVSFLPALAVADTKKAAHNEQLYSWSVLLSNKKSDVAKYIKDTFVPQLLKSVDRGDFFHVEWNKDADVTAFVTAEQMLYIAVDGVEPCAFCLQYRSRHMNQNVIYFLERVAKRLL